MKIRVLFVALILSVGVNIGVLVGSLYRRRAERPTTQSGCLMERSYLNRRLNLTREQLADVSAMCDSMYQRGIPLRRELCDRRMELLRLMQESNPDSVKLDSLTRELASLQARLELQVVRNARQISAALKPEQRRLFVGLFESQLCDPDARPGHSGSEMNCSPRGMRGSR
jgi:Spy/CpxP family protein refolding chaperone